MSKLNRREHLAILLESDIVDAKGLLESLVAAMGDDEYHSNIEYVMNQEDWEWRIVDGKLKNIYDKKADSLGLPADDYDDENEAPLNGSMREE